MPDPTTDPDQPTPWRRYLRFSSIGIELAACVMIGLIGGQWLDKRFGTEPYLLLAGLLFGLTAGFRSIYRALKDLNAQSATPPDATASKPGDPNAKS
jgi:ATP synthase protein I